MYDREREFHDHWAADIDPADVKVHESFSATTSPEPQWIVSQFGSLRGRRVLELGAGAGEASVYFALQGAEVTATDLSSGMLEVVKKVASIHGVTVDTAICSADDLSQFGEGSFDIVYAANLLHHVDIEKTLGEVKRVLKPGGTAGFWDPVAHNPVINVYRRMASQVRTEDEHPIRRQQMKLFTDRFAEVRKEFFWLTALLIFLKFYLIDQIHPNEDRYWKRVLREEKALRPVYSPLAALDRVLLRAIPILGWWSWNIAVVVRK
ncbi:MAG: class I SAM-dependent methyltransferase [Proteobacteria bacterium]|nr:class I SAM-dependent methyltransferase [Pseudomonadota bacterium]